MNKQDIQEFIANGKLAKALDLFAQLAKLAGDNDLQNTAILLSARLNNVEKDNRMGVITADNYQRQRNQIMHGVLGSLGDLPGDIEVVGESGAGKVEGAAEREVNSVNEKEEVKRSNKPKVFISYRHADAERVKIIKADLESNSIDVFIDYEQIKAGEDIKHFITRAIKASDYTLSVVSEKSLSSPWVSIESDLSFNFEAFKDKTHFIACSLDGEFFKDGFVSAKIREVLEKIKNFKIDYNERKELLGETADTSDLDGEIKRYSEYANNLGKIVARLKESLTVDLSEENYEQGLELIVRTIKDIKQKA